MSNKDAMVNDAVRSTDEDVCFLSAEFESIELIGQGGMGVVYKAIDRRLSIPVAIKLLGFHNDELAAKRLQKEAQALAELQHPNIVKVLRFQTIGADRLALVMEYFDGSDLSSLIEMGALSRPDVLAIFRQVCAAIAHAHQQGVIHRDIKPSNILVRRTTDGAFEVKVVDFGLASRTNSPEQKLTRTGTVLGTPSYMSPEQCTGNKVTFATDIYSTGCVLYECLSGKRPFDGESAFEVMYKQLHAELKRPSNMDEADYAVVLKAMAIDPTDRFNEIEELADALCNGFGHLKTQQRKATGTGNAVSQSPGRNRIAILVLGTLAAICALVSIGLMKLVDLNQKGEKVPTSIARSADIPMAQLGRDIADYLDRGEVPPAELWQSLREESRRSTTDGPLRDAAVAFRVASYKVKDLSMANKYRAQSIELFREAARVCHQFGRIARQDATIIAIFNLPTEPERLPPSDKRQGEEVLKEELRFAKRQKLTEEYIAEAKLNLIAYYKIYGDEESADHLLQELQKAHSKTWLHDVAVVASKPECNNELLGRILSAEPNFPK